jgi:triacylglycerol lipase
MKEIGRFFRIGIILAFTLMAAIVLASPVLAADTSCQTKYPIILAHGMGFAPSAAFPHSFPGIVEALQAKGAAVYYPAVPAIAGTREKAEAFKVEFAKIQALYPTGTKFNVIGHSHGGLYTRDAITNLGIAASVASLTTVDSPHRGSYIDQLMLDIVKLFPMFKSLISGALPFTGDPAKLDQNNLDLSVDYMTKVFNPNTPNKSGIYYQSFTCAYRYYDLLKAYWDGINMIVKALQGESTTISTDPAALAKALYDVLPDLATECYLLGGGLGDGLVQVSSAKWGTYLGLQQGPWYSKGLNHLDAVNIQVYGQQWDAVSYWVKMVQNLKAKGY